MYSVAYLNETRTFHHQTSRYDTGAAADAASVPAYEVYEEETGTAILSGNMALLNDAGTTGFYSEQITLSAANGFETGKCYCSRATATVNSVAQAWIVYRFVVRTNATLAEKWLKNKVTHALNTRTFTLYDDDGTTVLATRTYSEADTSTGTVVTYNALS